MTRHEMDAMRFELMCAMGRKDDPWQMPSARESRRNPYQWVFNFVQKAKEDSVELEEFDQLMLHVDPRTIPLEHCALLLRGSFEIRQKLRNWRPFLVKLSQVLEGNPRRERILAGLGPYTNQRF